MRKAFHAANAASHGSDADPTRATVPIRPLCSGPPAIERAFEIAVFGVVRTSTDCQSRSTVKLLDEAERVHSIEYKALSGLINKCDIMIQGVVHQKDRLLTSLADDLAEIMSQVSQAVERLDGARNPAEAIDRGVTDAWRDLQPLRDELDVLWTAQDWAMTGDQRVIHSRSEHLDDDLASDLRIANLDEVFTDWKHPPQNHALQRWDDRSRLQPWPSDPIQQLVWLCTSGAKVWCPTTRQLDDLKAQRLADTSLSLAFSPASVQAFAACRSCPMISATRCVSPKAVAPSAAKASHWAPAGSRASAAATAAAITALLCRSPLSPCPSAETAAARGRSQAGAPLLSASAVNADTASLVPGPAPEMRNCSTNRSHSALAAAISPAFVRS